MAKKGPQSLACPKCGMKAIYFRKDGSVRCNRCGYEGDVKGKE